MSRCRRWIYVAVGYKNLRKERMWGEWKGCKSMQEEKWACHLPNKIMEYPCLDLSIHHPWAYVPTPMEFPFTITSYLHYGLCTILAVHCHEPIFLYLLSLKSVNFKFKTRVVPKSILIWPGKPAMCRFWCLHDLVSLNKVFFYFNFLLLSQVFLLVFIVCFYDFMAFLSYRNRNNLGWLFFFISGKEFYFFGRILVFLVFQ